MNILTIRKVTDKCPECGSANVHWATMDTNRCTDCGALWID